MQKEMAKKARLNDKIAKENLVEHYKSKFGGK